MGHAAARPPENKRQQLRENNGLPGKGGLFFMVTAGGNEIGRVGTND